MENMGKDNGGDNNFSDVVEDAAYLHENRTVRSADGKMVERYEDGKVVASWPVGTPPPEDETDEEKEFQELTEMMRKDQEEAQTKKLQGSALSSWAERKLRE